MDGLLLIARLALAAVFAVAGIAKLLDVDGSIAAVRGFHLPERLVRPVGLGLPVVEILAALLLLPTSTAWLGAVVAAILLGAFLAGMANSLRLGEAPDCHCFGQLHSEPVGPRAVGRNAVLLVVALFVVVEGYGDAGASPLGALARLTTFETVMLAGLILALTGIAAEGWFIAHLLKQSGRFLLAVDELRVAPSAPAVRPAPVGARPMPDVTLRDLDGHAHPLTDLLQRGRRVLLIFSDPTCGPCAALRPDVRRWQTELASLFTLAVISRGDEESNRTHAAEHHLERVYLETDRHVSLAFGVTGTPAAVLISADGSIESEVAGGATAIKALVARAMKPEPIPLNSVPRPPVLTVGQPAPEIALPDLSGDRAPVELGVGRETVLLFWNPTCGFCQRMAPDLLAWEASAGPGDPTLVVVSTGDPAANARTGFASRVLLDEGLSTGRRFGAGGTPSAIAIDGEGKVASKLGVGAQAVLELLHRVPAMSTTQVSSPS